MGFPRPARPLLWALIGSVVWLAIHPLLLTRSRTLLPDIDAVRFLYSSSDTETEWLDYHRDHWRCISEPGAQDTGCGYNLALSDDYIKGVDFSGYDTLQLVLTLNRRQSDMAVFFRNYNSAYSTPDDGNSAQYSHVLLGAPRGRTELTINLTEFRVAQWWLRDRDLAPEHRRPQWSNVTVIGLRIGADAPPVDHRVHIRQLRFHGEILPARLWWVALASIWFLGWIVWLVKKVRQYTQRAVITEERLAALVAEHRDLYRRTRRLKGRAEQDPLSGLFNRRGLELACDKIKPQDLGPVTVVFVDIDSFKAVNDHLGHRRGDSIIKLVSGLMMEAAGPDDLQARWGGEEFLWLCLDCDEYRAEQRVDALRCQLSDLDVVVVPGRRVTLSAGVSRWLAAESLHKALDRADRALYRAKNAGRNRVRVAVCDGSDRRAHPQGDT